MKYFLAILVLAFGFHGAEAQGVRGYNAHPDEGSAVEGANTSIVELIANPQRYDNRRVRIIGFLRLEFEGNGIYLHQEDFIHGIAENAIWVDPPKAMTKEQMNQVNNKYVICEGVFHAKLHGHMGMFAGELSDINRLESWDFERSK
jgi:hypothetical protein